MKKFIIIISLVFIILILYSFTAFGYFRDNYWECTNSGEQSRGDAFGRVGQGHDSNKICQRSCCILCVSRSPSRDCFGGNAQPMCSCSQGTSTDLTAPVLTVNNPIENNVYAKRSVDFNISVSERSKLEYIDNNNAQKGFKFLCKNCLKYNRKVNFKDGLNDISIRATDNGENTADKRIVFTLDSKKPSISKTEPKSGKYGNSDFNVYYDEESLVKTTLFYRIGASTQYASVTTNECERGTKKNCTISVNNLENGDLYYKFEIEDIAGRKAMSKEQKIIIDNIDPEITLLYPSLVSSEIKTYAKVLLLNLTISEKSDLIYKDLNGDNRFINLCKNCNSYNRNVRFKSGTHNIIIKALDKAGNMDEESLVFNIQ